MRDRRAQGEKPVHWVGAAKRDLMQFPPRVIDVIGTALSVAQFGGTHQATKAWKGEGPGVREIVVDHAGATFRAIYSVRFERAIYVLHCFQKKSTVGVKTAKRDVDLVGQRLRWALGDHEVRYGQPKT